MKKNTLVFLLVMVLLLLCGCDSIKKSDTNLKKYEEADSYLNDGDYESALPLFEELAENDYKDSAEKLNKAKYGFVTSNLDEEDTTVYEYLEELIADNYKDSKKIYDELYSWKLELAFCTSSRESMIHQDTLYVTNQMFPYFFVNYRITGGKPGESLHGKYILSGPYGQEASEGFYDGGGNVISIMFSASGIYAGRRVFAMYDDYGNLLGEKSAIIR